MRFLALDPNDIPYFFGALVVAIAIVFLYSRQRFGESTVETTPEDLMAQLLPKYLATKEEYSNGLLIYIAAMTALLVALSFLGNPVLDLVQLKFTQGAANAIAIPILVALALVGLVPNVPYLKDIEWNIRHFAHQRAFIPAAALATTETLTAAGFDFSQYRDADALADMDGVEAEDFERPRGSLLYDWARLNCILYALKARYDSYLDGDLLKHYEHDVGSIYDRRQELISEVLEFKRKRLENPRYTDEPLRRKLKAALWQLYILVGCAVRLRAGPGADIYQIWRMFGFVLRPVVSPPEYRDTMLVGLAVMSGSAFAAVYLVFGLAQTGLWQPSNFFPAKAYETLIWAVSAGMAHGAAIFVSDHIRDDLNTKDRWFFARGSARVANGANYVRIAVGCAVVGYGVLFLWGLLFQPPSLGMAEGVLPFALLPATTGAFYAYHLDNVELASRPPRRWEVALQALATGAVGFVAAGAWLSLGDVPLAGNIDYVLLVTSLGAVVGGSLGWYIPEAVSQNRYNPLDEAKKERALSLEAMAAEKFDNFDKAKEWLSTPLALLKDVSPTAAAATIEGYQEAVVLLNRRSAAS